MDELHDITTKVEEPSKAAGLQFNVTKTKVMKVISNGIPDNQDLVIGNASVENVHEFCYLGALFTKNNNDS